MLQIINIMKREILISSCIVLCPFILLAAPVKPEEVVTPPVPEIWVKAGVGERIKAQRAAEMDGDRLLVERIYGLKVDADTTVNDLALKEDSVKGAVSASLVGAFTEGEAEFLPDGRVQIVRAVKVKEICDTLNRVIKGKRLESGAFEKTSENVEAKHETKEKVIEVMGNAAIPGSEGHAKVRAKRAAEIDTYRRLAGRMMGVKITSKSTVRDFCLQDDSIVAALAQTLKAATPTAIKYKTDGSCDVTMQVKVAEIIRTTRRFVNDKSDNLDITDEIETKTFSETGTGVIQTQEKGTATNVKGNAAPFSETEILIKEVVKSSPVIE